MLLQDGCCRPGGGLSWVVLGWLLPVLLRRLSLGSVFRALTAQELCCGHSAPSTLGPAVSRARGSCGAGRFLDLTKPQPAAEAWLTGGDWGASGLREKTQHRPWDPPHTAAWLELTCHIIGRADICQWQLVKSHSWAWAGEERVLRPCPQGG